MGEGAMHTAMQARYRLHGGMGSPYSLKMRAALRYRRIPHDWVLIGRESPVRQKHGGANVIPVLEFPDGSAMVDSTPLLLELERRVQGRSLVPDDPAMAFLAWLVEDMADEWLTKLMFHYRWYRTVDQQYSAEQIIADNSPGLEGEAFATAVRAIRDRQVSRMALVGCTPGNAPLIEQTYHRVLDALQKVATRDRFLFGTRPSVADVAVYGQLRVLSEDHTPHLVMRARAPRVYDWLRRLDDASGIDGDWCVHVCADDAASVFAPQDRSLAAMHASLRDLLAIAADSYLPFLAANARALQDGASTFSVTLRGMPFAQAPFRYQGKCLAALRARFGALPAEAASRVRGFLGPAVMVLEPR
jgi:glutathione S-transferase